MSEFSQVDPVCHAQLPSQGDSLPSAASLDLSFRLGAGSLALASPRPHPCSPISSYSLFLASSPQYVFAYMFSGKHGQLTRLSFFGCVYMVMSVGTHMSVGVHVCTCGCGCQRTTSRSFHKHLPSFGVWLVGKSGHPAVAHLVITGVVSEHCHIQICMCILGI